MFGRLIRIAALAGAGAIAWRWWQNKQAEDREYATGESFPSSRAPGSVRPGSTPGTSSTLGTTPAGSTGSTGSASGMDSAIGARVNQVPAQ